MSTKTILRDISQAVGNGFPIFWENSSWEWRGKRRRRSVETSIKEEAREVLDNAVDECKMSCFPSGSKLLCVGQRAGFTSMSSLISLRYRRG